MDINICFGLNNDYSQHCGCTIASILYNADKNKDNNFNFYIISDYISDSNKQKFSQLKSIRNFNIEYLIINSSKYKGLNVNNDIGISAFFRFESFKMLNVERFLYLDCDIIVRKDISQMYGIDFEDNYCAGVEDILNPILKQNFSIDENSLYINSGVMLINQSLCKKDKIYSSIINFLNTPWDMKWGDQDIINKIFENRIKGLDLKYNCLYPYNNYYSNQEYYAKMAKDPAIIHYITDNKPWMPGKNPYKKTEYFKYLKMTPWYNDFIELYMLEENSLLLDKMDNICNLLNEIKNSNNP